MTRQRAKLWSVAASLFTLINLGGAGMAAVAGEVLGTSRRRFAKAAPRCGHLTMPLRDDMSPDR